mmetsp:Transcript_17063/g.59830  ORF Transcript_17063/g.59830 Transcript_17063/m.59830 type:complete len:290 (-) Transcript_17063:537-1406(-)
MRAWLSFPSCAGARAGITCSPAPPDALFASVSGVWGAPWIVASSTARSCAEPSPGGATGGVTSTASSTAVPPAGGGASSASPGPSSYAAPVNVSMLVQAVPVTAATRGAGAFDSPFRPLDGSGALGRPRGPPCVPPTAREWRSPGHHAHYRRGRASTRPRPCKLSTVSRDECRAVPSPRYRQIGPGRRRRRPTPVYTVRRTPRFTGSDAHLPAGTRTTPRRTQARAPADRGKQRAEARSPLTVHGTQAHESKRRSQLLPDAGCLGVESSAPGAGAAFATPAYAKATDGE